MNKNILRFCLSVLTMLTLPTNLSAKEFKVKSEHLIEADGAHVGFDSYTLIRNVLGKKAIESPDLYSENHPEVPHIIETTDDVVGPHFVFFSHLENDRDRDKKSTDRQRNEIKVHDKSNPKLRAFKNETMQYRWKFKVGSDFKFSKNFTHFFQIKGKNKTKSNKNGGDSYPLITLTAVDRGDDGSEFQLRYNSGYDSDGNNTDTTKFIRKNLSLIADQWVEILVQVKFSEKGSLRFQIKSVESQEILVDIQKNKLDLWRGETKTDFARPKWGIYRSLKDKDKLRSNEEQAGFADFSISKGKLK